MDLLKIAILLFTVAAMLGSFLAYCHFTKKPLPLPVAMLHGFLAAVGVFCVAALFFLHQLPGPGQVALGLFLMAAGGGLFLFYRHLREKPLPSAVVILHMSLALAAYAFLASGLFTAK
jgi:hypothetical protein